MSHQEYCQFPLEAPTSVEARFKPEVIKQKTLHIYETKAQIIIYLTKAVKRANDMEEHDYTLPLLQ